VTQQKARVLAFITALLGAVATFIQFYHSLMFKLADGYSVLYGINHFFSFFTCQINTLVFTCLFCFSIFPNSRFTRWFLRPISNGGVLLYILIVGIIFYLLLYKTITSVGWDQAATHVVHGFVPLAFLYLWYNWFRTGGLQFLDCVKWLMIPGLYFLYILGRGELLLVYPYFFLNAARYGYAQVLINAVAILFFFLLMGALLVFIDKRIKLRTINK
jgi:hypothetical protein